MRTDLDEFRMPREILADMDKEDARTDPRQLTRLEAELRVSLAAQAEEVSRRDLKVASIACVLAVVALGVSLFRTSKQEGQNPGTVDPAAYKKQVDAFDEQTKTTADQLARADAQLLRSERQLARTEQQAVRMDSLILKWEEQAKEQDRILAAINQLLNAPTSERRNDSGKGASGSDESR